MDFDYPVGHLVAREDMLQPDAGQVESEIPLVYQL